jgi:hypothetical protein
MSMLFFFFENNVDVVGKLVRVLGIRDFEWPLEWRIVVVTNLILWWPLLFCWAKTRH